LVVNDPGYEATTIIAAYEDGAMAERRMIRMTTERDRWLRRQDRLEAEGSPEAWLTDPPHNHEDLCVIAMSVIPHR